jgi:hypothetical protein
MKGSVSPGWAITGCRPGYWSKAPLRMSRTTWMAVSMCQPHAAVASTPATYNG